MENKTQQENSQSAINNQSTQKEDIFWLEQRDTASGTKILSCKLNGKHYIGFWFTKEQKREDGTTYQTEVAKMRICNWEGCQTCHPSLII